VKLMIPGELALVCIRNPPPSSSGEGHAKGSMSACHSKYGYGTCDQELPPGISESDELDFEIELLDYDKEAHWQVCLCVCVYVLVSVFAWGVGVF